MLKRQPQDGFTLIELVTTILVATVFLLALNNSVTSYTHTGQEVRDFTTANSYVEAKVEALRNTGYNSLAVGTTDISSELPAELLRPRSASLAVTAPSSGIKKVDISVTYNDQGASRTYSYTTYIGELGVGQ